MAKGLSDESPYYWLRSPAKNSSSAGVVAYSGWVYYGYTNQTKVDYKRAGVVPTIKIQKNSKLWSGTSNNPNYNTEKAATYSYVELGSYPQSEVTGALLTDNIVKATYDVNGDGTVGNEKYRRVNVPTKLDDTNVTTEIKNYLYDKDGYYKENDVIKYRHISEKSGTSTIDKYYQYAYKYFKYEPIKWRVLNNDGTNLKLVSDVGLDTKKYYNIEGPEVSWATSTLRPWLNNDFFNSAFTSSEQSIINTTQVVTLDSESNTEIKGANTTNDKVYLLAVQDLRKTEYGFNSDENINSPSRRLNYTPYSGAVALNNWTGFDVPGEWWLRSPGYYITNPVTVYSSGTVRTSGRYDIYSVGVVPVIDISIDALNKLKQPVKNDDTTTKTTVTLTDTTVKKPIDVAKITSSGQIITISDTVSAELNAQFLSSTQLTDISGIKIAYDKIDALSETNKLLDNSGYKAISKVFDFKLVGTNSDGNEKLISNFDKAISLTINLSDDELIGINKSKLRAFSIKDDGTLEELPTTISGNKVTFTTTHFSKFIIAEKQDSIESSPTSNVNNTQTTTVSTVKTGDVSTTLPLVVSALLSIVGIIGFGRKKSV